MELEVWQQVSHMCDGFSRVDANLEVLDGRIDHHKAERDQMLNRVASLERTVNSLVELGTLGAEGVLPSRQIESFLRVFKQLTHNLPSRQVVSYLSICPPL